MTEKPKSRGEMRGVGPAAFWQCAMNETVRYRRDLVVRMERVQGASWGAAF